MFDPGDPFHADPLEAIYPAAERRGYEIVLRAGAGPVRAACRRGPCHGPLRRARADRHRDRSGQLRAPGARLPVAVVGRRGDDAGPAGVRTAGNSGAQAAVDLLAGLGHRRIRHVDGGRHLGAAGRRRGYRAAMRRHGLPADIVRGGHTGESGVHAARDLPGGAQHVTAVFAGNDRCAAGVLDTLLRAGAGVPGEVSVIGCGGSRLARLTHIDLTTLAQDPEQMARLAVKAVIGRLEGDPGMPPRDILLHSRLVLRGTTGPAPARLTQDGP